MKLISITKSPLKGKKWRALFEHTNTGTKFKTDFGAVGYTDFTMGASAEKAALYRLRHKKDLDTNNPTRAGYLSYYILWSSPNFEANVRAYKKMFHM